MVTEHMRNLFSIDEFILQKVFFSLSLIVSILLPVDIQANDSSVKAKLAVQSMLLDGISREGVMAVVGERGHVLVSSRGENWEQVIVPTRATLTGVYFHDKQNGWAVGHDAVILLTTDAGKHWQKTYYDPEGETPLFDIWFKDDKHGLAIGAYGLYLVSNDGGVSWNVSEMNINTDKSVTSSDDDDFLDSYDLHLNSIAISENGTLYIAAEAGNIYRSDDSGVSWIALTSPYIGSFFGVLPLNGDSVLAFGLRGHLFRSNDAGESWQEIKTPTQEMLTNGIITTAGEIYITGLGGTILKSIDDGLSFLLVEQGHRDGFTAIIQSSEDRLFTVGEKGVELLK
tara:strand:+ start:3538 stop:4560 length:1023 start_codon:yes stop_codon:yes gene_type:complete